jgi:hypothetical protein
LVVRVADIILVEYRAGSSTVTAERYQCLFNLFGVETIGDKACL